MLDATTTFSPAPPATTNGLHYDPNTDPDSPLADSPDTPINTVSDVAVKITSDIPEVESDVRHEPYQVTLSKLDDDASIRPQIDTPIDPSQSFFSLSFLPSSHLLHPSSLPSSNPPFSRYAFHVCHSFPSRRIYGRRFPISKRNPSKRGC